MISVTYAALGLAQLALAIWGARYYLGHRASYLLIPIAVAATLTYDNFVIALGSVIGFGLALSLLNTLRFWLHALLTPMMLIFAFGVARRVGFKWAQSRAWHTVFCVVATALIALGVYVDVLNFMPVETVFADSLRYTNSFELFKGPPIPAMLTILVCLVIGALVWLRARWPWFFMGALLMFICAGAAVRAPVLGNIGEVGLVAGSLATWMALDGRIKRTLDARNAPLTQP